jgi:predicted  nucleic acid-binding Zn-ribbon protein
MKDSLLRELQKEKDKLASEVRDAGNRIQQMTPEMKTCMEVNAELAKALDETRSAAEDAHSRTSEVARLKQLLTEKSEEAHLAASEVTALSSEVAELKQKCSEMLESKNGELYQLQTDLLGLQDNNDQKERRLSQLQNELEDKKSLISDLNIKTSAQEKEQKNTVEALRKLQSTGDTVRQEKEHLSQRLTEAQSELSRLEKHLDDQNALRQQDTDTLEQLESRLQNIEKEKEDLNMQLEELRAIEVKMNEVQAVYASERDGFQTEIKTLRISLTETKSALERAHQTTEEEVRKVNEKNALDSENLKCRLVKVEKALKEAEKTAEVKTRELHTHQQTIAKKYDELVQEALIRQNTDVIGVRETAISQISPQDPRLQGRLPIQLNRPQLQVARSDMDPKTPPEASRAPPANSMANNRKKPNRLNTTVLNKVEVSETRATTSSHQPDQTTRSPVECKGKTSGLRTMNNPSGDERLVPDSSSGKVQETRKLSCSVDNFDLNMKQMSDSGYPEPPSSALSDPLSSDGILDMAPLDTGTSKVKAVGVFDRFTNEDALNKTKSRAKFETLSRDEPDRPLSRMEDRPKSQANIASRILSSPAPHIKAERAHKASKGTERLVLSLNMRSKQAIERQGSRSSSPDDVDLPGSRKKVHQKYAKPTKTLKSQSYNSPPAAGHSRKRKNSDTPEYPHAKRHQASSQLNVSQTTNSSCDYEVSQPQSQDLQVVPTPRIRRQRNMQNFAISDQNQGQHRGRPKVHVGSSRSSARKGVCNGSILKVNPLNCETGGKRPDDFDATFNREIDSKSSGQLKR